MVIVNASGNEIGKSHLELFVGLRGNNVGRSHLKISVNVRGNNVGRSHLKVLVNLRGNQMTQDQSLLCFFELVRGTLRLSGPWSDGIDTTCL